VQKTPATPVPAELWPGLPLDLPPWIVALMPLTALGLGLGFAIRGGLLIGIAQRPGAAAVSGVLILALVVPYPYPALAGGGYRTSAWARLVISDPIGSAVAVFDPASGTLLHQTRFTPFGAVDRTYDAPGSPDADPDPRKTSRGTRSRKTPASSNERSLAGSEFGDVPEY